MNLEDHSIKRKTVQGVLWKFGQSMSQQVVSLIVSMVLARLLEPEEFGKVAMVNVIVGLSSIFINFGFGAALVQRKRLHPIHYDSIFYLNLAIAGCLTVLLFVLAPLVAQFYNEPDLMPITRIMSFSFLLQGLITVQNVRFRRSLNFKLPAQFSVISAVLSGIIGLVLAWQGFGVWALVAQTLSAPFLNNIMIWVASDWVPRFAFSRKAIRQLWGFSSYIFAAGITNQILERIDQLIIGKMFAPATLGFYNRGRSLDNLVSKFSSGSLNSVLFPVFSKYQKSYGGLQNMYTRSLKVTALIAFGITGGLFITAEDLIIVLFSKKWLPSVDYFKIMALGSFVYPISAIMVNVIKGNGNARGIFFLGNLKRGTKFFFISGGFYFGIFGFLYALLMHKILSTYLNMLFVKKEIKQSIISQTLIILNYLAIGISSVVIIVFIPFYVMIPDKAILSLVLNGVLFTGVYTGLNFLINYNIMKYCYDLLFKKF